MFDRILREIFHSLSVDSDVAPRSLLCLTELSVSHGDERFEVPEEKKCLNHAACENGNKSFGHAYQQKYCTS